MKGQVYYKKRYPKQKKVFRFEENKGDYSYNYILKEEKILPFKLRRLDKIKPKKGNYKIV